MARSITGSETHDVGQSSEEEKIKGEKKKCKKG